MQSRLSTFLLLLAACVFLFSQVQAGCDCDPADNTCLRQCVSEGQSCIASCGGDTACYNNCISSHWPGVPKDTRTTTANTATATSTTSAEPSNASSSLATTSTAAPSSTPINSAVESIISSVGSVASSAASAASSSVASVVSSASSAASSAITSVASFTPTPPTSSVAPSPTSGASKPLLVPAVAIGVAMVTVVIQFFFLARMGAALFH